MYPIKTQVAGKENIERTYALRIAKAVLFAALVLTVIITQTGCGDKEPVSQTAFCLDTSCEISVYDMDESEADEIITEAFEKIREYENIFSKTVEGSDVYKINESDGKPVEVSEETRELIELGIRMGDLSNGKFDITIGRVTALWDFKSADPQIPKQSEIDDAVATVDYKGIVVDENKEGKSTVTLENPEAEIDLGGIAKGRIADLTSDFLEEKGVSRAIINLGGNVSVIGEKADDTPWTIGIERPYSDRTEIVGTVKITDGTVVTSGVYERMFEKNGKIYHHVIDPETGYPAETDLESVSITATKGNSGFCDGLSTICLMLGEKKAGELIEDLQSEYPDMNIEAAFMGEDDSISQTDGMNMEDTEE